MVSFNFNRSSRTPETVENIADNTEGNLRAKLEEKREANLRDMKNRQERRLGLLALEDQNGPGVISSQRSNEINNEVRYGAEQ